MFSKDLPKIPQKQKRYKKFCIWKVTINLQELSCLSGTCIKHVVCQILKFASSTEVAKFRNQTKKRLAYLFLNKRNTSFTWNKNATGAGRGLRVINNENDRISVATISKFLRLLRDNYLNTQNKCETRPHFRQKCRARNVSLLPNYSLTSSSRKTSSGLQYT